MQVFDYWQNYELQQIDQIVMDNTLPNDLFFGPNGLFPIESINASTLTWTQDDVTAGLMQGRGLNGEFQPIPKFGSTRFAMTPGYYGEFDGLDEKDLTDLATPNTLGAAVSIKDLQTKCHGRLITRQVNRMTWIVCQLLSTGTYYVTGANGTIVDRSSAAFRQYSPSVPWSTRATATPIADLQVVQDYDLGQSVKFDASAIMIMTRSKYNDIYNNSNALDFGRFKKMGGASPMGIGDVNAILADNDLPQIRIVNDSYWDLVNGVPTALRFWPSNKVAIVGSRNGKAQVGNFTYTRNINLSDNGSGVIVKTVDTGADPSAKPPRQVQIFRGFNGGPSVKYPGATIILTC